MANNEEYQAALDEIQRLTRLIEREHGPLGEYAPSPYIDMESCGGRSGDEVAGLERWRGQATLLRLAHHCVAHPLMALSNGADWAIRFHDRTEDTPALRIYTILRA